MSTSTELRKLADRIVLAMAVSRSQYRQDIEDSIGPIITHYYQIVLAKKMGVSGVQLNTVKTWDRQIHKNLTPELKKRIIRKLKDGVGRYQLCRRAYETAIKENSNIYEKDAKDKVTECFGPNKVGITEQDQENFWVEIMEPVVRINLHNQGDII